MKNKGGVFLLCERGRGRGNFMTSYFFSEFDIMTPLHNVQEIFVKGVYCALRVFTGVLVGAIFE